MVGSALDEKHRGRSIIGSDPLQENRKASCNTSNQDAQPVELADLAHLSSGSSSGSFLRLSSAAARGGSATAGGGHGGGRGGSSGGHVDPNRVLSTAGVGGAALGLTSAVRAGLHTLFVGLSTDEVRHGLGVLGGIGGDVVAADAVVIEGFLQFEEESLVWG